MYLSKRCNVFWIWFEAQSLRSWTQLGHFLYAFLCVLHAYAIYIRVLTWRSHVLLYLYTNVSTCKKVSYVFCWLILIGETRLRPDTMEISLILTKLGTSLNRSYSLSSNKTDCCLPPRLLPAPSPNQGNLFDVLYVNMFLYCVMSRVDMCCETSSNLLRE